MGVPTRIILRGMFGKPTLQWLTNDGTESNGRAEWSREWRRYGQWTAKLSPGVQTNDDYGSVSWDVNGMRLADLEQISYVYRMGATEVVAPNVAIHIYDPNDIDNRADITLSHSTVGLGVTSGWQKYDLTTAIDGCFYFGNNIPTTTGLDPCDGTSATNYTLAQFQADPVFKDYVIGKITIEYGYYSTGFLSPAHICKVEVIHEGKRVDLELVPSVEEQLALLKDEATDSIKTTSTWLFGKPTLRAFVNASAEWEDYKAGTSAVRYGSYVAKLTGGQQAGFASKAGVYIPVNKMHLTDLASFQYVWYNDATESIGVFLAMHVYDPENPDRRADINYSAVHGTIPKTLGWNEFELTPASTAVALFWYGNNIPGTTGLAEGTSYTLAQFQADPVFSTYVIGQMEVMTGSYNTGYINPVHIAKIEINGVDITLEPSIEEQLHFLRDKQAKALTTIPTWTFGQPTLMAQGNGNAHWARGANVLSTHQKGSTGWVAQLYGGVQNLWGSAAEVYIPVNEMPLTDLKVGSTMWSWFQTATEIAGVGMVVWVHDPTDFDKRAEISMLTEVGHVELSAGWNAHELAAGNDCVWYGENTGTHGTTVTAGSPYNFSQFLEDDVFSTYTIYRISFAYGFQTGDSVFNDVYLADVKINGEIIRLVPDIHKWKRAVTTQKTLECLDGYSAEDVMSEDDDDGDGTDWDFVFGASGKIVQAVIASETNAITAAVDLYLFSVPPTCELDDNAANDAPVLADIPHYIGKIEFDAMVDVGSGPSYALATGLEMYFDGTTVYGVAVDTSGQDFADNTTLDITLTAELEA